MRVFLWLRISAVFVGSLLSLWPLAGYAQTGTAITELQTTIKIQSDGTAFVESRINYAGSTQLDWTAYSNVRDLSVTADGAVLGARSIRQRGIGARTHLTSAVSASTWVIDYTASTSLIRHHDRDQLYLKIFEEPNAQIYNILVSLQLPNSANSPDLSGDLYVINGVLGHSVSSPDPHQLLYSASAAGAHSLFTINASWSGQALPLTKIQQLRLTILNLELAPWLILGLLLPIAALLVLGEIYWRQRRIEREPTAKRSTPPSALPPILAGVLVSKKIYPNQIVALLVDLCQRGYLVIVKKNHQYYLSPRHQPDANLRSWEKEILDEIFAGNQGRVSTDSFKGLGTQNLFSPKVRDAFARIYQVITQLEIFAENPHLTRIRYKLIALLCYFGGATGLVLTAVFGLSPVILIPFAGTMAMAYLIIRISPRLIRYSANGLAERQTWLAFANYLGSDQPVPLEAAQGNMFERYLAYAVALNRTDEWAARFDSSAIAIVRPDWFISYEDTSTGQLVTELAAFTGKISAELATLKGPLVN